MVAAIRSSKMIKLPVGKDDMASGRRQPVKEFFYVGSIWTENISWVDVFTSVFKVNYHSIFVITRKILDMNHGTATDVRIEPGPRVKGQSSKPVSSSTAKEANGVVQQDDQGAFDLAAVAVRDIVAKGAAPGPRRARKLHSRFGGREPDEGYGTQPNRRNGQPS